MKTEKNSRFLALGEYFDENAYIIAQFHIGTKEKRTEDVLETLAYRSSIGIDSKQKDLSLEKFQKFYTRIFEVKRTTEGGADIKIAYPLRLFEGDNIPNLLSLLLGIPSNISQISSFKLKDISFPEDFIHEYKGPSFGSYGIVELIGVYDRELKGAFISPKLGLSPKEYALEAMKLWKSGIDIVSDDPAVADTLDNAFYDRVSFVIGIRRKAEEETGKRKLYCPNITARLSEMYARGKFVRERGGRAVTIDMLAIGFSGLQFIREQELGLILNAAGINFQNAYNGLSPSVIAKIARLIGVDRIQVEARGGVDQKELTQILTSKWANLQPVMLAITD